jgi:hypothetical protein
MNYKYEGGSDEENPKDKAPSEKAAENEEDV